MFRNALFCLLDGLFAVEPCLREEFVGIAYHLFFERLGQQVGMRQRKIAAYNLLKRQPCACMPFAYACMVRHSFSPEHLGSEHSVAYIGLIAVAFYLGCVGLYHSYVMQHGSFLNEVEVKIQFGMPFCYVESLAGYGAAVAQKDVFLNIAGGLKVNDPAIDLAVISAILSSNMDTEIEAGVCMAGEVGLSGEIRPVNRIEQRISEAEKLGFTRMLVPKHNLQGLDRKKIKIELVPVRKVEEAFRQLFG